MVLAEQGVDWWARGIGGAALLIAFGGLTWNVYHSVVRDKAKLAIKVSLGIVGSPPLAIPCLCVDIANVGRRPCTVDSCRLGCSGRMNLFYMPGAIIKYGQAGAAIDAMHKFPRRLEEGESTTVMFPKESITESLAEGAMDVIAVLVTDGAGKTWKEPILRETSDWLKQEKEQVKGTSK